MKMTTTQCSLLLLLLLSINFDNTFAQNVSDKNLEKLRQGFASPAKHYRPETWFHLNGNNISKEGLTLDLEAIKYAGLQGIHLFNKNGRPYPGVKPIKILSPEWEEMIRHAADECQRLGLKFTMQNCPGWSMTGGPWVPVEEAQRELVETVYRIKGGSKFEEEIKVNESYLTTERNYKDVCILAFPTPEGDDDPVLIPQNIETNNKTVPWAKILNPAIPFNLKGKSLPEGLKNYNKLGIGNINGKSTWVKLKFEQKEVIRSIEITPIREMILDRQYPLVKMRLWIQAIENDELKDITELQIPTANWTDRQYKLTLAIPETLTDELKITFIGEHAILPTDLHISAKPRLHNHEVKAAKALRSLEKHIDNDYAATCFIDSDQIIDLTDNLDSNGKLSWDAPEGDWTVIRFGHVNMLRKNKPAVPEATGWECSKLDKQAIENHLRKGMIGNLIKDGGPIGNGKLQGLLIDSWESFIPTWTMNTETMFLEFEQRRGYSMKKYLPATMGYIVENPEVTTKFLRDLRQTMDELFIDNFFSHFAEIAHEMGAEVYTEGAGGEVLPVDPMRYYGVSDIPMTEFWYPKAPSNQNEYAKPIYSAASAMHLYDKPFLAAEACTQLGVQWNEHPFTVKYLIDYNFTKGVNHLVFHTFSHTPQTDVYPGSSFGGHIGFPLVRQQTWWKHMPEWINYLTRCQYILQQGEYVADVLWYYGDHYERPPFDLDYFPKGYRFDYLNAEILHEKLSVEEGEIKVEGAGDYRIILLRDAKDMVLSTAKKLQELVWQGAIIVGDKPLDSPSLMDNEHDLKALHVIANELWGKGERGMKAVGKGKVYWGKTIEEVFLEEQITKDVNFHQDLNLKWIHRETAEADIYFVSNQHEYSLDASVTFRQNGKFPEIWNPLSGEQKVAKVWKADGDETNVVLNFAPNGSTIVIFKKDESEGGYEKVTRNNEVILDCTTGWYKKHDESNLTPITFRNDTFIPTRSGVYTFIKKDNTSEKLDLEIVENSFNDSWQLSFEPGWDVLTSLEFPKLTSLTESENEAIRHYSGTVTYEKEIIRPKKGTHFMLDLGEVHNIAELWCNGKKVGTRWCAPYVFDLSERSQKGKNKIEVKVTNTWRNQLIFDNSRPEGEKKTWTTNPPAKEETVLEPSGLVGPVILRTMQ